MNDKRKLSAALFGGVVVIPSILMISIISGAIYRIFTTPLDTSSNDLGAAGIGNLVAHPIIYGLKGAIEGIIFGGVLVLALILITGPLIFLWQRKQSKLPPIINNQSD